MSLSIGIVGLPNVGKSTLFTALTKKTGLAANYPFATIDPNVGIVDVPDSRLQKLADIVNPGRIVPATVEFVDIAGLVKGANEGEGLGNQFLANIRETDAICEVVRYFKDPNVMREVGRTGEFVDPAGDADTIMTELILADMGTLEKQLPKLEEEAKREAPIMREAQQMLRRWEAKDPEVYSLWETMNGWVYEGFDKTYEAMGVGFDKVYYESQTYLLGKSIVEEGLAKGVFYRRDDGSVWCDLTSDGLDEKLLLRGDGTSVYMTQDLGTALTRFREEKLDEMIYVVGNEQNYHFQVLKLILGKLGYAWADHITHLSYGMVELPEGKMKSREGTVVDADDLIDEMVRTAREMSQELGKFDDMSEQETALISRTVGLGALKYFILKVDPRKTMLFDPRESIDFNGNTGPFIQYTYARIRSVLRKAAERGIAPAERLHDGIVLSPDEISLVKALADYPATVAQAAENFSPAVIANYLYELSKQYNGYYHDIPILRESDPTVQAVRLRLSQTVAEVIASGAGLLGINVPERM